MITTIPDVNGELILSKDEIGYEEILNDFPNASYITIVTYNISASRNILLNKLRELDAEKDITIVSKIPNRWETYFSDDIRKNALTKMEQYCSRLDPSLFPCHVTTYFNHENHAKIIMTENIAYIGSQNFSDESANNFECGIIIRDVDEIKRIREEIVEEIIENSFQFSSSYYYLHQEELTYWLQESQRIVHEFKEDLFKEAEVGFGKYVEIVNYEASLSLEDWENIILSHQEIFSLIEYIKAYNNKQLDPSTIQTLEELQKYQHTIKTELAELAIFNPDVIRLAEEDPRYFDGEPEVYEAALQTAMNRVAEQQSEIIDKMRDKKDEIKNALEHIPTLLEQLITSLKNHKFYTNSEDINNTGLPSLIISDRD